MGHAYETSVVDRLRDQGNNDDVDDRKDGVGDSEQVRHWSRKPKASEGDLEVIRHGDGWKVECKRDEVEWPDVVVGDCLPNQSGGEGFSIVHPALNLISDRNGHFEGRYGSPCLGHLGWFG